MLRRYARDCGELSPMHVDWAIGGGLHVCVVPIGTNLPSGRSVRRGQGCGCEQRLSVAAAIAVGVRVPDKVEGAKNTTPTKQSTLNAAFVVVLREQCFPCTCADEAEDPCGGTTRCRAHRTVRWRRVGRCHLDHRERTGQYGRRALLAKNRSSSRSAPK